MNIANEISRSAMAAVKALYGQDVPEAMIQVQKTKREFEGHLTLVVFPLLRTSRKKPEETAEDIGRWLVENEPAVASYNVVKGFLNLTVSPKAWLALLADINADEHYGETQAKDDAPLVMIEYSSPNTNKPLHLGHVRNNLLGWSLAQIMQANGNRVVKTNIVNDRGIHICKSMLAWLKYGNGETPETSGKKGDHLIGDYYVAFDKHYREEVKELKAKYISDGMADEEAEKRAKDDAPLIKEAHEMLVKWEQGDPEVRALWEKMNSWVYAGFDETYKALGVGFDKIYYESQTYLKGKAKVEEGLEKGLFFRKDDGSVWADLTDEGLDQKLLLRADGTSVYMTQDIGTAEMRFADYPIDKMIYVVGNEQNYHFQVLSILLDRLGFKWGKELVHFSYGMVELPNGKMKSREGTVVDADDLIAEMIKDARQTSEELGKFSDMTDDERANVARIVGMGALKYFILKVDARRKEEHVVQPGGVYRLQRQHGSVHPVHLRTHTQHHAQGQGAGHRHPDDARRHVSREPEGDRTHTENGRIRRRRAPGRHGLQPQRHSQLLLRTDQGVQPVLPRLQHPQRGQQRRESLEARARSQRGKDAEERYGLAGH